MTSHPGIARAVTLVAALTGSALAGCTNEPAAPAADAGPAASFMNGPAAPGPVVIRFQSGAFAFLNMDPVTNLVSVVGLPADPATSPDPFCGGSGSYEILDWQLVLHGSGAINTLIRAGDVSAHVYDATAFTALLVAGDYCGAVTLPRLADGVATLRYTDNDFIVSLTRADAYGWSVSGTLTLASGGTARYLDVMRAYVRPDGSSSLHSEVRLVPAP